MLKKKITYEDYDGNQRTEDFYFNLNKAELTEMEVSHDGGLIKTIENIIAAQDNKRVVDVFKDLILKAYGVKSPDGRQFRKSQEISNSFAQSEAYSELFMELATNDKAAADFVNGIVPVMKPAPFVPNAI